MKYSGPLKIRAREVVSSVIEARRTHARTFGRSERLGAILARSDQARKEVIDVVHDMFQT